MASSPADKEKYQEQRETALEGFNHDMTYHKVLFPFLFDNNDPSLPLSDNSDQVQRCPRCFWELEDGACLHCEWSRSRRHPNEDSENGEEGSDLDMDIAGVRRLAFEDVPTLSDNEFIDDSIQDSPVSEVDDEEFNITGDSVTYPMSSINESYSPSFFDEDSDDQRDYDLDSDVEHSWAQSSYQGTNGTVAYPHPYNIRPPRALPSRTRTRDATVSRLGQMNLDVPHTPPPAYSSPQVYHSTTFLPSSTSTAVESRPISAAPVLNERQRREMGMFSATPTNASSTSQVNESGHNRVNFLDSSPLQPTRVTRTPRSSTSSPQQSAPSANTRSRGRRSRRQAAIVFSDESDEQIQPVPPPAASTSHQSQGAGRRSRPVVLDDEEEDAPEVISYSRSGYLEHDDADTRPEVQLYRNQVAYHTRGGNVVSQPLRPAFDDDSSTSEDMSRRSRRHRNYTYNQNQDNEVVHLNFRDGRNHRRWR